MELWLLLMLYLFSDSGKGVCFYNKYIPVNETASIKNKWEKGSGFYGKVSAEEEKWPLVSEEKKKRGKHLKDHRTFYKITFKYRIKP